MIYFTNNFDQVLGPRRFFLRALAKPPCCTVTSAAHGLMYLAEYTWLNPVLHLSVARMWKAPPSLKAGKGRGSWGGSGSSIGPLRRRERLAAVPTPRPSSSAQENASNTVVRYQQQSREHTNVVASWTALLMLPDCRMMRTTHRSYKAAYLKR